MIFLGIYTYLEDKWYDTVDWLNQYIPVADTIDSIDKVIPSFILFLAILIVLLMGVFVFTFAINGGGIGSQFQAEVTVLSRQGAPIPEAVVSFGQECSTLGDVSIRTDSSGKAIFKACSSSANVRVSKAGYSTLSEEISLEDNKAKIYLSQLVNSNQRVLNLKVKDSAKKIIDDVKVYVLCVKGGVLDENLVQNKNQPTSGFLITLPGGCDTIQIKATAEGYGEKKELIGLNEENKTITLEKPSTNGNVVFEVNSTSGKKEAIIQVTDELGREDTIIIDSTGFSTKNYTAGDYSYIATLYGVQKIGNFTVITNQTIDVNVFFSEVTNVVVAPITAGTALGIYLKLLDGNSGVGGAEVRVFFKKGNDTNYLTKLSSGFSGVVNHSPVSGDANREFYVIIKAVGYETKLIKVELKTATDIPQQITLSKGGINLTVKVVDDINAPVKNAVVSLTKSGFNAQFEEPQTSDVNGKVEFKSLPSGVYSLKGVSLTLEGRVDSISLSHDTLVVLKIITGSGNVKFNLLRKGEATNAYCNLYEKINNVNDSLLGSTYTTNGYYQATSVKADKEIYLTVPDGNYIYVESPVVKVKRIAQTRNVILYKPSDLPNANKVQMFLEGVYESNPWGSAETKAKKLMPGQKYYFLFTLIANNETSLNTTANIFASPFDKNTIDVNSKLFLEDAFSTRASIVQTSLTYNSSIIPYDPLVPSNPKKAKQLNVYFGEKQGFMAFPVLVEITVDANANGKTSLYWEGIAGNNKSILYSKEFIIGQSFCFGARECPELLFSNYLRRENSDGTFTPWTPVGADYPLLQLGDNYDLNVIVENLTDKEIGSATILGKIKSISNSKLLFKNDLNSVSASVNVSQFGLAFNKFSLKPLAVSPSATMIESLEKNADIKALNGNDFELKFNIRNREDINIQVIATGQTNTIYANVTYPFFYIKTYYRVSKLPAITIWDVKVKGENTSFRTDVTDENGEWNSAMDLSRYPKGTILVFTAVDTSNSTPARLEITLTDAFNDTSVATVPDCIDVKIGGADIKGIDNPVVYSQVGLNGGSFTIDSNCTETRGVLIVSDLGVSTGNKFDLAPGASRTVTLNDPASVVTQRSGMLGVYPMQIMQIVDKSKFNQVGFIDVIVSDSSSTFSISNPIFDLRNTGFVSAVITNNQFLGRKDIYYPQMDIATNSVGLVYTKPGVPETIKFNAVVKSHAIEALTTTYAYGSLIHQWNKKNKCNSKTISLTPEELIFTELAQARTDERITQVNDAINAAPIIETPDASDRDPTKSFYTLPTPLQEKIRSEIYPKSGSITVVSTAPIDDKEQKISFTNAYLASTSGDVYKTIGEPTTPRNNDVYEIIPKLAGDFDNSSCEDIFSLNCGASTGVSTVDTSASDEAELDSNTPDEADEEDVWSSSECSKCEINYRRLMIDPKSPEGYDGSDCSGVALSGKNSTEESVDIIDGDTSELSALTLKGSLIENVMVGTDSIWTKVVEEVVGRLKILSVSGCSPCKVLYFGEWLGGIYTKGKKKSWLSSATGGLFGSGGSVANVWAQDEYIHTTTFYNERVSTWIKELEFKPKEGTIVRLEPKYVNKVDVNWKNTKEIFTKKQIDAYKNENILLDELIVVPHGIVPFSVAQEYAIPDPNNTLVEYRSNGLIYSQIPVDTIPPGVRLFLKGGYIYAEYIGDDKAQAGNEINFTISRINLQGSEYAIISVRDWVNGEKVEKMFQVKLLANPNNCYSTEGIAGLTGKEFVPRLSFNWDWNGISYNQCDSTNNDYTYCDATQFTISMFKRLEKINSALMSSNNKMLPQYASFYAYLIKDKYSTDFLKDFEYYYSTNVFSSNGFNSTTDSTGYDKFITENKINYFIKSGSANIPSGGLSTGGLYRVEVETVLDNSAVKSLFSQGNTNATINVTFTLIKQAPNYNLFYETPFDGGVGKQPDGTFSRKDYGSSLNQGAIPISDSLSARTYSGTPFVPITYVNSSSLVDLANQKVLTYTKSESGKVLEFNPMQPTPIVMTIKGTTTALSTTPREILAPYIMSGHDATAKTDRKWTLVSSTFGKGGKCTDFLGNQTYSFVEKTKGAEKYFQWNNVTKSGTIELATVFFTPPTEDISNVSSSGTTLVDVSSTYSNNVKLRTSTDTTFGNPTGAQLDYFYKKNYSKYKSLKGMFEMIAEGKLCVSQSAAEQMQVWWNQDYLNSLIESVAYNKANSCTD